MSERGTCDKLLDQRVETVRAVSAGRAKLLAKLGIRTVRDLLTTYPHRYIDLGTVSTVAQAPIGETVTVVGVIDEVTLKQPRPRMHILEAALLDGTGVLMGVWFRQPWMADKIRKGMRVALSGKVYFDYGFKRMNAPFMEVLDAGNGSAPTPKMIPVHPATEKLSTTWMRRFAANALEQTADVHDPLPVSLKARYGLVSRKAAWRSIHFPHTPAEQAAARRRLAYEEALYLQLEMMRRRDAETREHEPIVHMPGAAVSALREALPFTLTDEQDAAVADIQADMCAERCMNRMLLGDVGTGKTAVAAFGLALAADSGCQAAMMAPTEVLARQYGEKLGPLLEACGVSWATLTGSTPADQRGEILEGLQSGNLQVLFGTHALIEPNVQFSRLSLVIIDEQHRFGVNQRAALRAKGPGSDLLVMTATPIPRTLALTLYGDLETSYIRMRPGNRPPTRTQMVSRDARAVAYDAIRAAVGEGRQAYIICPLVGLTSEQRAASAENGQLRESLAGTRDISDAKAAEDEAAYLQRKVFPNHVVGLLTGRMNSAEKQQVMDDFRTKKIDILVATTVVEVGVDVPNATVMMVEDAERFGLSQLHQLRGRVGRGQHPGEVYLVADPGADDTDTQQRMQAICEISDGFELAEADLRARREGDVLGSRQHGFGTLKLVNVVEDTRLVERAHKDARALLDADPGLAQHEELRADVEAVFAAYDEAETSGA